MPNGLDGEWVDHPIGDGRHFKTVKEARAYAESLGYKYLHFEAIVTAEDYVKWREHGRNLKREMKKYGYGPGDVAKKPFDLEFYKNAIKDMKP